MNRNSKAIYAQSSDIKSRTYLEYRKDMKKKAIAELEILLWLQERAKKVHASKGAAANKRDISSYSSYRENF